jgi:hypothetical protein
MKVSLELWINKVYKREVNQCMLSTPTSIHFYKQALNGRSYFCGIGLHGSGCIALACPLEASPIS